MKQGERSFANSHQDDLPVTSHYPTDSLDVWPDHRAVTNWPAQSLTQRKPDSTEVRKRLDRYCDSGDPGPGAHCKNYNPTRSETGKKPVGLQSVPSLDRPADISGLTSLSSASLAIRRGQW